MRELPPVAQRFLRYVRYDTQSSTTSETYPSTEKQKVLLSALRNELRELGLSDATMDKYGYVTATLPSNVKARVPVVGLIAHVDTSPDVSGANVNPQVHAGYDGTPIKLNENLVLTPELAPLLMNHKGETIITSDGTTLLGADDKAGIAEIITFLERLKADSSILHGKLRIAFTPDEEVGNGTKFFDVAAFGAEYAYTLDGGSPGEIVNETFSADAATVTFKGINVHPGLGKGKLASAIRAEARFVDLLPGHIAPETTDGKQGFLHPTSVEGGVDEVVLRLILRDFDESKLTWQRKILEDIANVVRLDCPGVDITVSAQESYRNMRHILDKSPLVMECAMEAVRRTGLEPKLTPIRGGTDGSHLSYNGLPTPNLFSGGDLFHSRTEWIAVEDMEKAIQTMTHLVQVWVEKSL